MICEGLCDTEDWCNDAVNLVFFHYRNTIFKYIKIHILFLTVIPFHNITVLLYILIK